MTLWLVALTITVIAIPALIAVRARNTGRLYAAFQDLAEEHHLTLRKGTLGSGPRITDSIGGFPALIYRKNFGHGRTAGPAVAFEFKFTGMRSWLQVSTETLLDRVGKMVHDTDIEMKNPAFDRAAFIQGENIHEVRALLHPQAVRIITELITSACQKRFTLLNSRLVTLQSADRFSCTRDIQNEVDKIVRLGRLLTRTGTTAEMLHENFMAERKPARKMLYLESMHAILGPLSPNNAVIQSALKSKDPELRFQAIKAMGKEGYRHITSLLPAANGDLTGRIAAYALYSRERRLVPFLIRICPRLTDWELRMAVIRFLASTRHPDVQGFLRKELSTAVTRPPAYERECIRAMGTSGSRGDIEFLHEIRDMYPGREIDQAIARIQERIGTGDEGWLSVSGADEDEGDLSIAEEEKS